jgi:hypothetical protein
MQLENRKGQNSLGFLGDLLIKIAWLLVAVAIIGGLYLFLTGNTTSVFGWG